MAGMHRIEVYIVRPSPADAPRWAWRIRASNGRVMAVSRKPYAVRANAVALAKTISRGLRYAGAE